MSTKILIVNADDFGQSPGINKGIIECFEKGIVTSTSLMVRYPAAKEAAEYAKKNPLLGVGLHLDLGEWILKDGEWKALYEVIDLKDTQKIKNEITNQLEIFQALMGCTPTHIDSHQHVHLDEHVQPIAEEFAATLGVTLRKCSHRVNYCGNFYGQLSDGSPWHHAISVEGLKETLAELPVGITELACHAGLNIEIKTLYKKEREIEVITLCDKGIREFISKYNIQLNSFSFLNKGKNALI